MPSRAAHSSGVIRSSPCAPSSTDLVAGPHLAPRTDVDHQLVHRHHADHGVPPPADQHLLPAGARAAEDAVGVADGQRGDVVSPLEAVAQAVRHPFSGRHRLHEGDLGGEPDGRRAADPAAPRSGRARCRRRRCRTARGRSGWRGGRWRRPSWRRGAAARRSRLASTAATASSNALELPGGERVVGLVGHRAVGPHGVEGRAGRRATAWQGHDGRRAGPRPGACRCRP